LRLVLAYQEQHALPLVNGRCPFAEPFRKERDVGDAIQFVGHAARGWCKKDNPPPGKPMAGGEALHSSSIPSPEDTCASWRTASVHEGYRGLDDPLIILRKRNLRENQK
jgi:hypothetical protein